MPPSSRRSKAWKAARSNPLTEHKKAISSLISAELGVIARIERTVKKHEDDAVFLAFEDNRVLKLYSCGLRCRHCAICKCGVATWKEPTNDTTIRFLTPFNWCADAPEDFLISTLVDVLRRMTSVPSVVILCVPRASVERLRLLIVGLAFVMDLTRIREMHVFLASGGDAGYHYHTLSAAMDAQPCRTVQEVAALALPDETVRTTTVRAPLFKLVDIVATLETEPLDEPASAFVLARNADGEVTYRTAGFLAEAMWEEEGGRGRGGAPSTRQLAAMLEEYEGRGQARERDDAPPQSQPQKEVEVEEEVLLPLFAPPAPPSSPVATAVELEQEQPDGAPMVDRAIKIEIKGEPMEEGEEETRKAAGAEAEGVPAGGGEGAAAGAVLQRADALQQVGNEAATAPPSGGEAAVAAEQASGSATVATGAVEKTAQTGQKAPDSPDFIAFDFGPVRGQIMGAASQSDDPSGAAADELPPPAKKQRKQPSSKIELALEAAMQLQQTSSASGSEAAGAASVAAISTEQREALEVAAAAAAAEKQRSLRPRKETPHAVRATSSRLRSVGAYPPKKESSVGSGDVSAVRVKEEVEVKKEPKKKRGRPSKEKKEGRDEEKEEEEDEDEQEVEKEKETYGAVTVFKKARHSSEGRRAIAGKLAPTTPADDDVIGDRIRRLCAALEENGDATEALLEQWQRIGKAMQPRRKADTLLAALKEISEMQPAFLVHPVVDPFCYLHD